MAKVSLEYDTVTKKLVVSMDGKALSNVQSASFYETYDSMMETGDESEDTFNFSLQLVDESTKEEDGYRTCTYITAKDSQEGRKALAEGGGSCANYPDLVYAHKTSKVHEDIKNFFSNCRG